MDRFDPLSQVFWQTIGYAICCGAIVGTERQLRGKPAGVRTSILVCLGTAMFLYLTGTVAPSEADLARVLGQLVTGIGFLGAGVMLSREGVVTGVTTAAVIWMLAAIGAAIGFGHFRGALALSGTTVIVLVGVEFLESRVAKLTSGVHRRPDPKDIDSRR